MKVDEDDGDKQRWVMDDGRCWMMMMGGDAGWMLGDEDDGR